MKTLSLLDKKALLITYFSNDYINTDMLVKNGLVVTPIVAAKASKVYQVDWGIHRFIIKILPKNKGIDYIIQKKLFLNKNLSIFPKLISTAIRSDLTYLQIFEYAQGQHVLGTLNSADEMSIISTIATLLSSNFQNNFKPVIRKRLSDILEEYSSSLDSSESILKINNSILSQSRFWEEQSEVIHFDLHRGNILFNQNNALLLDLESLVLGPSHAQIACLLLSCFFNYEPLSQPRLTHLLNLWNVSVPVEKLGFYMLVRALIGASFFLNLKKSVDFQQEDENLLSLYMEKIQEIIAFFNLDYR